MLTSLRYNWHNWYLGGGLQYQYWQREIKAANNVSQLHEYYRWYGPQLELGYTYKPTNYLQFELGLNASWLNGNLLVDLTNIPTTRGGTRNFGKPKIKLTDGYAAKTFLLAKIQLNKQVDLIFKYQLGYRYFPKSATTSATDGTLNLRIHEPESSNNFYYYGTGLSYKF